MVLTGRPYAARLHILDRLIASAMPVFQLCGVAAQGDRRQLVPQADAEYRLHAQHFPDLADTVRIVLWVSRAIRQHDAIRSAGEHLLGLCGRGPDRDVADPPRGIRAAVYR